MKKNPCFLGHLIGVIVGRYAACWLGRAGRYRHRLVARALFALPTLAVTHQAP